MYTFKYEKYVFTHRKVVKQSTGAGLLFSTVLNLIITLIYKIIWIVRAF